MTASRSEDSGSSWAESAGARSARRRWPARCPWCCGPLQVTDLLLQRVDLGLLRRRRGGRRHRRRSWNSGGLPGRLVFALSSWCRPCTSVFRMRIDWPSERAASRQLLRPEQHDQHNRDDQDLPRAVEQVTNHVRPLSARRRVLGLESTRAPAGAVSAGKQRVAPLIRRSWPARRWRPRGSRPPARAARSPGRPRRAAVPGAGPTRYPGSAAPPAAGRRPVRSPTRTGSTRRPSVAVGQFKLDEDVSRRRGEQPRVHVHRLRVSGTSAGTSSTSTESTRSSRNSRTPSARRHHPSR